MKFSKSFQSEAVPEWKIKYIDYKGLKKKLRLVQKARISRERELSYPLSNRQTPLQYDKNQGFQENQREVIEKDEEIQMDDEFHHHSYPHEFPTPITPPPPLNTSRRTSYQSQTSQGRFSFTGMAETANSFMRGVSWKLHNNPKRQSISENTRYPLITSLDTIMDQVNPEERVFFVALEQELEKVKIFYDSQEKEAIRRFAILQQQLEDLKALKNNNKKTSGRNIKQSIGNIATRMSSSSFGRNSAYDFAVDYKEAKKKIRKAIFEFYRGVKMLNEYRVLNKLGFIKILKKYDISSKRNGSQIYLPKVKSSNFIKSDILNLLIKDVEIFNGASLRVGLCLGIAIPIIIFYASSTQPEKWDILIHLYIGVLLPIIMSLLIGINMYIWDQTRINYKFIFEFDPRDNLNFQQYLEGRQIACFYYRVEFRDFFIADVLNSLSYSFTTMRLLTCIFNEDCNDTLTIFVPLLGMIPATIRMIHCLRRYHDTRKVFPHLINALKYLSTMIPLWALYFDRIQGNHFVYTTWIISQTIATLYAFSWDVLMDWSLFSLQSENYLLRDHLVYNENWIYYAGIAVNFFLRSSWVFILIFPNDYVNVALFIAIGEIIRRWIWNFFRVENEHVNNCGQFRAIKDVPLPFEVAPIQIKIGEEIINSDSKTDSVDDMIIDDKESPVSTNWLVNLIRSNRANGTSKKDDWKDFEASGDTSYSSRRLPIYS
ncbi:21885_t:CDS:10 [Entrophospora sp. SA101]|nr:20597_t:CDS:10 [Entrophospora sp. SA101]CAJ0883235.1 21885_t:CDS:10 [Entrophospora sp. SA101]